MLPALISREHERAALRQAILAKDTRTIERLEKKLEAQEVPQELLLYYNAFLELDSERLFEGGPIPSSAIRAWSEDYDLTFRQFDIMRVVIRKVDNAVLVERGKKMNGKSAQDRGDSDDGRDRRQAARP